MSNNNDILEMLRQQMTGSDIQQLEARKQEADNEGVCVETQLDPEMYDRLASIARSRKLSIGEVIEKALRAYL
jgi:predicted DNA-binding ribbon-helix-helix protein